MSEVHRPRHGPGPIINIIHGKDIPIYGPLLYAVEQPAIDTALVVALLTVSVADIASCLAIEGGRKYLW